MKLRVSISYILFLATLFIAAFLLGGNYFNSNLKIVKVYFDQRTSSLYVKFNKAGFFCSYYSILYNDTPLNFFATKEGCSYTDHLIVPIDIPGDKVRVRVEEYSDNYFSNLKSVYIFDIDLNQYVTVKFPIFGLFEDFFSCVKVRSFSANLVSNSPPKYSVSVTLENTCDSTQSGYIILVFLPYDMHYTFRNWKVSEFLSQYLIYAFPSFNKISKYPKIMYYSYVSVSGKSTKTIRGTIELPSPMEYVNLYDPFNNRFLPIALVPNLFYVKFRAAIFFAKSINVERWYKDASLVSEVKYISSDIEYPILTDISMDIFLNGNKIQTRGDTLSGAPLALTLELPYTFYYDPQKFKDSITYRICISFRDVSQLFKTEFSQYYTKDPKKGNIQNIVSIANYKIFKDKQTGLSIARVSALCWGTSDINLNCVAEGFKFSFYPVVESQWEYKKYIKVELNSINLESGNKICFNFVINYYGKYLYQKTYKIKFIPVLYYKKRITQSTASIGNSLLNELQSASYTIKSVLTFIPVLKFVPKPIKKPPVKRELEISKIDVSARLSTTSKGDIELKIDLGLGVKDKQSGKLVSDVICRIYADILNKYKSIIIKDKYITTLTIEKGETYAFDLITLYFSPSYFDKLKDAVYIRFKIKCSGPSYKELEYTSKLFTIKNNLVVSPPPIYAFKVRKVDLVDFIGKVDYVSLFVSRFKLTFKVRTKGDLVDKVGNPISGVDISHVTCKVDIFFYDYIEDKKYYLARNYKIDIPLDSIITTIEIGQLNPITKEADVKGLENILKVILRKEDNKNKFYLHFKKDVYFGVIFKECNYGSESIEVYPREFKWVRLFKKGYELPLLGEVKVVPIPKPKVKNELKFEDRVSTSDIVSILSLAKSAERGDSSVVSKLEELLPTYSNIYKSFYIPRLVLYYIKEGQGEVSLDELGLPEYADLIIHVYYSNTLNNPSYFKLFTVICDLLGNLPITPIPTPVEKSNIIGVIDFSKIYRKYYGFLSCKIIASISGLSESDVASIVNVKRIFIDPIDLSKLEDLVKRKVGVSPALFRIEFHSKVKGSRLEPQELTASRVYELPTISYVRYLIDTLKRGFKPSPGGKIITPILSVDVYPDYEVPSGTVVKVYARVYSKEEGTFLGLGEYSCYVKLQDGRIVYMNKDTSKGAYVFTYRTPYLSPSDSKRSIKFTIRCESPIFTYVVEEVIQITYYPKPRYMYLVDLEYPDTINSGDQPTISFRLYDKAFDIYLTPSHVTCFISGGWLDKKVEFKYVNQYFTIKLPPAPIKYSPESYTFIIECIPTGRFKEDYIKLQREITINVRPAQLKEAIIDTTNTLTEVTGESVWDVYVKLLDKETGEGITGANCYISGGWLGEGTAVSLKEQGAEGLYYTKLDTPKVDKDTQYTFKIVCKANGYKDASTTITVTVKPKLYEIPITVNIGVTVVK